MDSSDSTDITTFNARSSKMQKYCSITGTKNLFENPSSSTISKTFEKLFQTMENILKILKSPKPEPSKHRKFFKKKMAKENQDKFLY